MSHGNVLRNAVRIDFLNFAGCGFSTLWHALNGPGGRTLFGSTPMSFAWPTPAVPPRIHHLP
jgi:hypothetical protein